MCPRCRSRISATYSASEHELRGEIDVERALELIDGDSFYARGDETTGMKMSRTFEPDAARRSRNDGRSAEQWYVAIGRRTRHSC